MILTMSCRPSQQTAEETRAASAVRAFLFDAELRRAGKPTSFRLEIFQTDTAMALSGRGYLGKGALRGRVTADSLVCYFPSTNEYIDEPVLNLMHALECEIAPKGINLVTLLDRLPDSTSLDPTIKLVSNHQDGKRPSFIVYVENCPWQMELTYRQESIASYRLDEFTFFDGKETRLKATCREYKQAATVKPDRFEVRIPSDAQRIIP